MYLVKLDGVVVFKSTKHSEALLKAEELKLSHPFAHVAVVRKD